MTRELEAPRLGTIVVDGDELTVRLNPPISVIADLQSESGDRIIKGLEVIVVAHPYTRDGQPAKVADFDRELATAISKAWGEKLRELPLASAAPSSPPT